MKNIKQQDDWLSHDGTIASSLEKWQRAVDLMTEMLGATLGFVMEYHQRLGFRAAITSRTAQHAGSDTPDNPAPPDATEATNANIYCRKVVTDKCPLYERDATGKPEWANNPAVTRNGYVSYYGVPLMWPDGTVFGTLCVYHTEATDYPETFFRLIDCFRDLIEADLKLHEQFHTMRSISMTDGLTELNNRSGFEMLARQKIRIAKRYGHNIGIIFIDLDNMKHWNDDYGHAAGDAALRAVARAINASIREVDICGRIGGDEFAILGYVRNRGDLTAITTRIRNNLLQTELTVPTSKKPIDETPAISCGVTVFFEPIDQSLEDMLAVTDLAMYRDKNRKR